MIYYIRCFLQNLLSLKCCKNLSSPSHFLKTSICWWSKKFGSSSPQVSNSSCSFFFVMLIMSFRLACWRFFLCPMEFFKVICSSSSSNRAKYVNISSNTCSLLKTAQSSGILSLNQRIFSPIRLCLIWVPNFFSLFFSFLLSFLASVIVFLLLGCFSLSRFLVIFGIFVPYKCAGCALLFCNYFHVFALLLLFSVSHNVVNVNVDSRRWGSECDHGKKFLYYEHGYGTYLEFLSLRV